MRARTGIEINGKNYPKGSTFPWYMIYPFFLVFFGVDNVKWMFINAGLGLFGIYAQINWLLSMFNKNASDYSWQVYLKEH